MRKGYVLALLLLSLSLIGSANAQNNAKYSAPKKYLENPYSWSSRTTSIVEGGEFIDGYQVYFDHNGASRTLVIELPDGTAALEIPVSTLQKIYQKKFAATTSAPVQQKTVTSNACRTDEEMTQQNVAVASPSVDTQSHNTTVTQSRRRIDPCGPPPCRGEQQNNNDDDSYYEEPARHFSGATPAVKPTSTTPQKSSRGCDGPEEFERHPR